MTTQITSVLNQTWKWEHWGRLGYPTSVCYHTAEPLAAPLPCGWLPILSSNQIAELCHLCFKVWSLRNHLGLRYSVLSLTPADLLPQSLTPVIMYPVYFQDPCPKMMVTNRLVPEHLTMPSSPWLGPPWTNCFEIYNVIIVYQHEETMSEEKNSMELHTLTLHSAIRQLYLNNWKKTAWGNTQVIKQVIKQTFIVLEKLNWDRDGFLSIVRSPSPFHPTHTFTSSRSGSLPSSDTFPSSS